MLGAALIWAVFITRRSRGNAIYAFPITWGLGWLAFKTLTQNPTSDAIGIAAIIGFGIIALAAYFSRRHPNFSATALQA